MFNPLKRLAKALYDDNWDDMPYLPFIVIMALFAVVILIIGQVIDLNDYLIYDN